MTKTVLFLLYSIILVAGTWGVADALHPKPPAVPAPTIPISASCVNQTCTFTGGPDAFSLPPDVININGDLWRLERIPMFGEEGKTDCDAKVIYYDAQNQKTKEDFRDTMWHEITHAAWCGKKPSREDNIWWRGVSSEQHVKIWMLAGFLTPFVHDNPEFMKWAEEWK